jgi:hypothetical protein
MQTTAGDAYYIGYYQLEGNNKILHRVFEGNDKELGRVYIAKEQSPIYYIDAQALLRLLQEKYPNAKMYSLAGGLISALQDQTLAMRLVMKSQANPTKPNGFVRMVAMSSLLNGVPLINF